MNHIIKSMPWCPECKMEYISGIKQCADCQVPLVDEKPSTDNPLTSNQMVAVALLENEIEAAVLKGVLADNGINSIIHDFIISQYNLPEYGKNGWGELMVLDGDYENAKFIISEYLNSIENYNPEKETDYTDESDNDLDDDLKS